MVLYTALYSAQNIQTALFEIGGYPSLGFYSNAVAYMGQGLGSIASVHLTQRHADSKIMACASILSLPFLLTMLLPAYRSVHLTETHWWYSEPFAYSLLLATSLLNGLGQGLSQPSAGHYISECASERSKGLYYSIFWSFYMGSQLIGSLIAAFVTFDQRYLVLIMCLLAAAAIALFFGLRPPPRKKVVKSRLSLQQSCLAMARLTVDSRFRLLVPQLLWTGVSISYFSGLLLTLLTLSTPSLRDALLAHAAFGLGEILGGLLIGFVVDKLGSKRAILLNLSLLLSTFGLTTGYLTMLRFNALAIFMCLLWGMQDSGVNTQVQEMLGFEFESATTLHFAVYNLCQCLACFAFQLVQVGLAGHYLVYTVCLGGLGLLANGTAYFFEFKREHPHACMKWVFPRFLIII